MFRDKREGKHVIRRGVTVTDYWGRGHCLNLARRVTAWRLLRARIGWTERDTYIQGDE